MTTYSSLLPEYLGEGLAAALPVSISIPPGSLGIYYATDTKVQYLWNGGGWDTPAGGGTVSSVVAGSGLAGGTITATGTISLGTIAAGKLLGNSGTIGAVPTGVAVGSGLTLSVGGTLSATGGAGSVTSVITQGGPFLANGTITTSGTIDNSVASLTPHGIVLGEGTSPVAVTAAMTAGQLLIGATGADPVPQTMSGDATINSGGTLALGSIVAAATTGGATAIPVITFDTKGRITAATTASPNYQAGTLTGFGNGVTLSGGTLNAVVLPTTNTLWDFAADVAITSGAAPSGQLYWNNATQASATKLGLSAASYDGADLTFFLEIIASGSGLYIQDRFDSTNFQLWTVTGALTNNTTWFEVPVSLSSSSGTGTTNFPASQPLFAMITAAGGAPGTVTKVVSQGGPFLANSTITTAGTIANAATTLTKHGVILGSGTAAATVTAAMTNGQLLIGATSADPAPQTMSGDATINSGGTIAVTKSGGVAFGSAAFINTGTVGGTLGLLNAANSWSAAQRGVPATLASAATVTPDFSTANNFQMTMTVSGTLANPTNVVAGQAGQIAITQDGTGGRTLALGTNYKTAAGAGITLTTTAAAVDILSYYVADATHIDVSQGLNFK